MNNYNINKKYTGLRRAKSIGEISFLKLKNIPIRKIDKYQKKTYYWFENNNKEADKVLAEYYFNEYIDFFNIIQETRKELFKNLHK
ncbi:uncharacterized protein CBO05P1_138 [Clostridium botulinum B str. Osaka05]|uniref:Uncharacterized protein n=1 Tax=Clostridium botulinum B str. Osaka05 TaxID=1407017 RepID=A0A060N4W0_CLOBO|nr:hypothetical protein [Clostridium botulinum]BAO04857.1 uncharacterized protein CBO05P1_138 [Clostridium botulinum B str. Osaka05]